MGEVAAESHLLVAGDAVVVADVAIFGRLPVMDPQRALALERVVVVANGVQQPTLPDLVRLALGVHGRRDVVRQQKQSEVQSGHARAHDPDARLHRCLLSTRLRARRADGCAASLKTGRAQSLVSADPSTLGCACTAIARECTLPTPMPESPVDRTPRFGATPLAVGTAPGA